MTSGRARHQQKRCDDGCTAGVLPNRPIPCASCRARPIPRGHHATRGPDAVASACCPLPRAGRDLCPPVLLRVPPVPTPDTLLNAADSRPRPRRRGKKPGEARPGHVPSTLRACAKHSATHACTPSACMASAGSGGQQGWLPLAAPSVHSNHTGRRRQTRCFPCSATTVHEEHMHTGRRRALLSVTTVDICYGRPAAALGSALHLADGYGSGAGRHANPATVAWEEDY